MKNRDFWSGLFWLVLAILVCLESFRLGIGHWKDPRSGFLPFIAGVTLASLSLFLLLQSFASRAAGVRGSILRVNWRRWTLPLMGMIGYAVLMEYLGYLLSTFFLLLVLFSSAKVKGVRTLLLVTVVTTLLSFFIFHTLLKTQFPVGVLGV